MTKAAKIKLVGSAILIILAVILVAQNSMVVTMRILIPTFRLPLAVLLVITLLIGYAAGILTSGFWTKKR